MNEFVYFKTSPDTDEQAWLPLNRQLVGLYLDWTTEYHIWKIPATTVLSAKMMDSVYQTYDEAKKGAVYIG